MLYTLLEDLRIKHGKPREVVGDSAYNTREIREYPSIRR